MTKLDDFAKLLEQNTSLIKEMAEVLLKTNLSNDATRRIVLAVRTSDEIMAELCGLQSGEWQDIATAPKDGTAIDVWVIDNRGAACVARRYVDVRWLDGAWKHFDPRYNGLGGHYGVDNGVNVLVTHWMPLPKPPEPR